MRTPITYGQQIPGAAGSYDPNSDSILSYKNLTDLPSGTIAHEVAHRIYNKAGLVKYAPILSKLTPKLISDYIQQSSLYNKMNNAGSPEQISNEGLSFASSDPLMMDKQYVDEAAARIADPKLKETLMRIFANRAAAQELP